MICVRRSWLVILASVVLALIYTGAAEAHPNTRGPHNENGNTTLDIYKVGNFNGALGEAIANYGEGNLGNAPKPRTVSTQAQADVLVRYLNPGEVGAGFSHRNGAIDILRISPTSPNPVWTLTHELGHAEAMQDLTMAECDLIAPDPVTGYKSIMCHARWEGGDLTAHDWKDLQMIPNHRLVGYY
jgi:hypothetical protein